MTRRRNGSIPWGYRAGPDRSTLTVDPTEQRLIRDAQQLGARGLTQRQIARALNSRGYTNRAGRPFLHSSVPGLLDAEPVPIPDPNAPPPPRRLCAVDLRDAEGWVACDRLGDYLGSSSIAASRAVQHRLGVDLEDKDRRRKRKRTEYRLTDDEWQELAHVRSEMEVINEYGRSFGWHYTEITDEDHGREIRLRYRIGNQVTPIAWQWRRSDGCLAPDVLTLREALDQLTGDHPVRLSFRKKVKDTSAHWEDEE